MITKFKIYEKVNLKDIEVKITNINQKLIDILISDLSLVVKKKKKKSIRPESITGYFKKEEGTGKDLKIKTKLIILMSNTDLIEATHSIEGNENNINIEVNEVSHYNLNNQIYTDDILIEKISEYYKEHLKLKNWKLK